MVILKQIVWRPKNRIKILVGPADFELLIKTCKIQFWSVTQEWLGLPKNLMSFLSSSDSLLQDAYIIFHKSVDNFEIMHKTCSNLVKGALPVTYTICGI